MSGNCTAPATPLQGSTTFASIANAFHPLKAFIRLVTHPKLQDYLGIIALGIIAEATRRSLVLILPWLEDLVSVRAVHTTLDESHNWILAFWMSHPDWQAKTKHFNTEVSYISASVRSMPWTASTGYKGLSVLEKRKPPRPRLMPPQQSSFVIWYKGRLVRLTRRGEPSSSSGPTAGEDKITVQILGGTVQLYKELLADAKRQFQAEDTSYIDIKMIDPTTDGGSWKQIAHRGKRGLHTIVTEGLVAETIYKDMKEFFGSSEWYAERGIPHRRGLLLHGVPGSGKTSCIHAAVSELDLDIYIVALVTAGLTDSTLIAAMSVLPRGAVVVFEDIDVAMPSNTGSLNRQTVASGHPPSGGVDANKDEEKNVRVTLSGLLNAIDGLGGGDGRVLFMTTNDISKLDPALIRAGRCDRQFRFENASKDQARRMFEKFYGYNATKGDRVSEKSTAHDIADLAREYASAIPHRLLSTATIQGHLMLHKSSPTDAVDTISAFVQEKKLEKADKEADKATCRVDHKHETAIGGTKEGEEVDAITIVENN